MSAKPETTFYTSVHRHLPPPSELYRMKNNNQFIAGIADHWYDGLRDLWVEWKFIKVPVRDDTGIDLVMGKDPPISYLQQDWLSARHANGRAAWVIVGSKDGGVIMRTPREWKRTWDAALFRASLESRPQIAQAITQFCLTRK